MFSILDGNPRIQGFRLNRVYSHFFVASDQLTKHRHKCDSSAAIWMDELLFNTMLTTTVFYEHPKFKFIYLVRSPEPTLNQLVVRGNYSPLGALRYYCYRLRRICEMAKRTPGAVLLTWEEVVSGRGFPKIEEYLELVNPLVAPPDFFVEHAPIHQLIPADYLREAESSYERHLFFLKNQELRYQ